MAARADLQDLGSRKLMRMFAGQRREAEEAMRRGELPDFSRQQAETEDQLRALLLLLYIGLADGTRFKSEGLRELGLTFAETRTREVAGRIVERSRKRVLDIMADLDSRRMRGLEVKTLDIRRALEGIYGPGRAVTIATTETTKAQSAALEDVGKQKAEREQSVLVMLWRLRPCRHCTFCPLMHDMPAEVYGKYLSGPPAHPNCCCQLDLAFFDDQEKADKFIADRIARAPSDGQVRAAMHESGIFESEHWFHGGGSLFENCGTGDGGFKQDNRCANEDGSETPRFPKHTVALPKDQTKLTGPLAVEALNQMGFKIDRDDKGWRLTDQDGNSKSVTAAEIKDLVYASQDSTPVAVKKQAQKLAPIKSVQDAESRFEKDHRINLKQGALSDKEYVRRSQVVDDEVRRMKSQFAATAKAKTPLSLEIGRDFKDEPGTGGKYVFGQGIELSKDLRSDPDRIPRFGGHTVDDSLEGTFRHEFGHEVWNRNIPKGKQREFISKFEKKYVGTSTVSRYGGTNASELFAESFSAYTSKNYQRGSLPEDLESWLDSVVRGRK